MRRSQGQAAAESMSAMANDSAERALLGAIMIDNSSLESVSRVLQPSDFFQRSNAEVYRAILGVVAAGMNADLVTVVSELENTSRLEQAGGAANLSSLLDGVPRVANAEHYATLVKKCSLRRQVAHAAEMLLASSGMEEPETLLADMAKISQAIASQSAAGNGHAQVGRTLTDFLLREFPEPDYLIDGLIARGNTSMIYAKPHHLKSYLALGLALEATRSCKALGHLPVPRPVRTIMVQIEDPPGQVQKVLRTFLHSRQFGSIDIQNFMLITRDELDVRGLQLFEALEGAARRFRADWIVLDVLRRLFPAGQSINDPKDAPLFLEQLDTMRMRVGAHVTLVHHDGKREGGDIFTSAMGSMYLISWAKSIIRLTNKAKSSQRSAVDCEFENGAGVSLDPMRLILEPEAAYPLVIRPIDDDDDISELQLKLGEEWTLRDLADARDVSKSNAWRLVKKWLDSTRIEKVAPSKPGKGGGMARFRFVTPLV